MKTHNGLFEQIITFDALYRAYRRARKGSLKRFKRRVRRLQRQYAARQVGFPEIHQQLASWMAHARHGEALPAVSKYLQDHPFRREA